MSPQPPEVRGMLEVMGAVVVAIWSVIGAIVIIYLRRRKAQKKTQP